MTKKYSLEQLSQIVNKGEAMKMSVEFVYEQLQKKNQDKNIEYKIIEYRKPYDDGGSYLVGYNLIRRTKLEKPIIKNEFFGLIKKEITHKRKTLVCGDFYERTLYLKENDKNLINLCTEIVKLSQNPLGKNHLYLGLEF